MGMVLGRWSAASVVAALAALPACAQSWSAMSEVGATQKGDLLLCVTVVRDRWFVETGGYASVLRFWSGDPAVRFAGAGLQRRWKQDWYYVGASVGGYGIGSGLGVGAKASVGVEIGPLFAEVVGRGVAGRTSFAAVSAGVGWRF